MKRLKFRAIATCHGAREILAGDPWMIDADAPPGVASAEACPVGENIKNRPTTATAQTILLDIISLTQLAAPG